MRTDTRQRRAEREARCAAIVAGEDGCPVIIGQPRIAAHPACMDMERQQAINAPYTCFSDSPAAGTPARAHAGDWGADPAQRICASARPGVDTQEDAASRRASKKVMEL